MTVLYGNLHFLNHLIASQQGLDPSGAKVQQIIEAEGYAVFSYAAQCGHRDAINFLLAYPSVFAHAEMHVRQYTRDVNPFVAC